MSGAFVEDKTCRICGAVDQKNVNIFDARQKALLYKILTMFPITMYESDPLPKNICKKCSMNVSTMHDECQRLVKIQQKWIERVRINQPNHPYVRVLDIIEECHQDMLQRIKGIAPDFIYKNIRLLPHDTSMEEPGTSLKSLDTKIEHPLENFTAYSQPCQNMKTLSSFSLDYDVPQGGYNDLNGSAVITNQSAIGNKRRTSFKEIQHKLESNGCTLVFKTTNLVDVKSSTHGNRVRLVVQCPCCEEAFPNMKFLAKHQLNHLSVSDRRIFDKKYLEKGVRRGRLIPVDDKKCIRCLNCWKVFEDNRKILEHWSNADCEFFCQICGAEFARNPKQLREHVHEEHGITYKSSRRQVTNMPEVRILNKLVPIGKQFVPMDIKPRMPILQPKPQIQIKSPNSPPSKKPKLIPSGRVTCNLCSCTFPNYQSKNSHMRAHKGANLQFLVKSAIMSEPPPLVKAVQIKQEKDIDENEIADQANNVEMPSLKMTITTGENPIIKRERLDEPMEAEPSKTSIESLQNGNISATTSSDDTSLLTPKIFDSSNIPTSSTKILPLESRLVAAKKVEADHMQYDKMYNCHPCGKKFSSKTDLFQHKKLCQSNNKFGCRFCLRAFVTSADLQMHIMLMHKGS